MAISVPVQALNPVMNLVSQKDSRWLTLEVCREYQRNKCSRPDVECKYAHPPTHVEVQNGRVVCCFDYIKGKCNRKEPPCKYLHPPQHLRELLLQNGRNNLILKNMQMQMMIGGSPNVAGQQAAALQGFLGAQQGFTMMDPLTGKTIQVGGSASPVQMQQNAAAAAFLSNPYLQGGGAGFTLTGQAGSSSSQSQSAANQTAAVLQALVAQQQQQQMLEQLQQVQQAQNLVYAAAVAQQQQQQQHNQASGQQMAASATTSNASSAGNAGNQSPSANSSTSSTAGGTSKASKPEPYMPAVASAATPATAAATLTVAAMPATNTAIAPGPSRSDHGLTSPASSSSTAAASTSGGLTNQQAAALAIAASSFQQQQQQHHQQNKRPRPQSDDEMLLLSGLMPMAKRQTPTGSGADSKAGMALASQNAAAMAALQQQYQLAGLQPAQLAYVQQLAALQQQQQQQQQQVAVAVQQQQQAAAVAAVQQQQAAAAAAAAGQPLTIQLPQGFAIPNPAFNSANAGPSGSFIPSTGATMGDQSMMAAYMAAMTHQDPSQGMGAAIADPQQQRMLQSNNVSAITCFDEEWKLLDTLPICRDFKSGHCARPYCKYVHLIEDYVEVVEGRVRVCKDYAHGNCKRSRCRFYHVPIQLSGFAGYQFYSVV